MIIPRLLSSTLGFVEELHLGKADLSSGWVYEERLGPDEYAGTVDGDGRMHRHIPMATDEYIGVIDPFGCLVHVNAASCYRSCLRWKRTLPPRRSEHLEKDPGMTIDLQQTSCPRS